MTKETGSIFEEHTGDKDLHSEKWLEWVLNSFKQLESSDIKQTLKSIRYHPPCKTLTIEYNIRLIYYILKMKNISVCKSAGSFPLLFCLCFHKT
jgi:hypothetical protein